jgi:hypothetical protein
MDIDRSFRGFREVQLAYVGLRLGLFKALNRGAMSVAELARVVGIPQPRIERLARGWIWADLIERGEDGRLRLTSSGERLVDDRSLSPADDILFQTEFFYPAWGGLYEYAVKGMAPYLAARGEGVFETLQRDPRLAALYAAPMAARSFEYSELVARRKEFDDAKVIVDVGGGHGRLVVDVLKAHPRSRGIVFDLPAMKQCAEKLIKEEGLQDQCVFEAGDVFTGPPPAADIYLMKWVLHDFGDEEALAILKSVRAAMGEQSRLLVIERLMPEKGTPPAGLANADMNMLVLSGGGERKRSEYELLLRAAGMEMIECDGLEAKYGFYVMSGIVNGSMQPQSDEGAKKATKKS